MMKAITFKTSIQKLTVLGSSALLAAGCATGGGGVTSDKAAVEKSRAYLEGLSYVVAGQAGGTCAQPSAAQKVAMSSLEGPSKDWKDLLAKASACAGDKNWKTLNVVAETLARTDINAPWGAYFMSVAAEGQGEWQRALWMVELAQKKAGQANGLFMYQHGRVMLGLKDTTRAMSDVQKAVSLEPKLMYGHLFLAEIYHRDLEWAPAAEHYRAVLSIDDKSSRALAGLAEVRLNQGDAVEAAALYQKAITWQPARLDWWLRLGSIYETSLKSAEQALATYKSLRTSLDKGDVKQRPSMDLTAKIKSLENAVSAARQPAAVAAAAKVAQGSVPATVKADGKPEQPRSKK